MLTIDFKKLPLRPGDRVLDAGCGEGRHVLACHRTPCAVVGIDLNPQSLRKTRWLVDQMEKQGQGRGPVLLVRGDNFRFPFPDQAFDRIICAEVIEHSVAEHSAIRELARVLKPGGKMALSFPTVFTEQLYDWLSREYFRTPGGHVRKVNARELARTMKTNGLRVYGISFAHAFHSPYWALRCVFGLHNEKAPLPSLYRRFLTLALFSKPLRRMEGICNYLFPKSIVLYAQKQSTVHRPQSTAL